MNLLSEIRSDLVNESASLANTLRKSKILAHNIGLPEFSEWVEFELNGYRDWERVPEYRKVNPTNLGTFAGPYGSMTKNVVLPIYNLPDIVKDFAESLTFFDGVGELEAQASAESLRRKWPQEMVMLSREYIGMDGGMVLVDAEQPIPTHTVLGILDQVKNRLLSFVLELQENDITPENMKGQLGTQETARNLFNITIYGNQNTVASGENVNQTIKTVTKGDLESLFNFLRGLNIDEKDIGELADAVSAEPSATDGRIGPKVQSWLGGMMQKMASGTLTVGKNTTAIMLAQAINSYFGINPPV